MVGDPRDASLQGWPWLAQGPALGRTPRTLFIICISDMVCAEHLLFFGALESWHGLN